MPLGRVLVSTISLKTVKSDCFKEVCMVIESHAELTNAATPQTMTSI